MARLSPLLTAPRQRRVWAAHLYAAETPVLFSLPEHSSVFSAELVAIDKALRFIEVSDDTEHVILADSLSSLLALRAFLPSNPLVQDILSLLTSLDHAGISVSFCWILSHVGIAGNERADSAARRSATRPCTWRFPHPAGDLFPSVATFLRCQWQRRWDAQTNNKLKEVQPVLGPWPSSSRKNRRKEVALSKLRNGHCYATHSYLLRGEDRPSCPHCDVPLTVAHVLLACPRHRASRSRILGRLEPTATLQHLLGDDSVWVRKIRHSIGYSPFPRNPNSSCLLSWLCLLNCESLTSILLSV